ncbi:MAG: hypothetical protein ABI307_06970 [Mycobacterium sp.]
MNQLPWCHASTMASVIPQMRCAVLGGLQSNDGRINEWQAWRDTNWPIINGEGG